MKPSSHNTNLLLARKEAGMTQKDLAEKVERSRYWINRLENNAEQPSQELAQIIAKAVNKSPEDIFGIEYRVKE